MRINGNYGLSFLGKRLLFETKTGAEIMPPPGISEHEAVESLQDAIEEAKELIAKNKARLKEILKYYENNLAKMPREVRKEYDNCGALEKQLGDYLKKLNDLYKPNTTPPIEEREKEIREETIKHVDDVYLHFWTEQKRFEEHDASLHDPLGMKQPLDFSVADADAKRERPASKEKTGKKMKPEMAEEAKPVVKKEVKPGTNEYILERWADIGRMLVEMDRTGKTRELTKEERNSLIFINGGESKKIEVNGRAYLLERDQTGNYIRLVNLKTALRGAEEEASSGEPVLKLAEKANLRPVWKTESRLDVARNNLEKRSGTLEKQMQWLLSDKTPAGSRISFSHIDRQPVDPELDPEGAETRLQRTSLELVKQYDGSVRINEKSTSALRRDKNKTAKRPLLDEVKTEERTYPAFKDSGEALEFARNKLGSDSQITVAEASAEELAEEEHIYEKEQKVAEEKNKKQFQSLAEQLGIAESDLFMPMPPAPGAFSQEKDYRNALKAYEDGKKEDERKYEEKKLQCRKDLIQFLKAHPIEGSIQVREVNMTVTVKNGEIAVTGVLRGGAEQPEGTRLARRYSIESGEEIA